MSNDEAAVFLNENLSLISIESHQVTNFNVWNYALNEREISDIFKIKGNVVDWNTAVWKTYHMEEFNVSGSELSSKSPMKTIMLPSLSFDKYVQNCQQHNGQVFRIYDNVSWDIANQINKGRIE